REELAGDLSRADSIYIDGDGPDGSRRRGAGGQNRVKSGVRIMIAAKTGRQYVAFLRRELTRAVKLLGSKSALRELSVALVGDATMSNLHHQFMRLKGPTDVLT